MTDTSFHIPRIETDRLILCAPCQQDFQPIADFFASVRSCFVGGPKPIGRATMVSYVSPGNTRSIALAKRLGAVLDHGADQPEGPLCQVYRHANTGAV